MNGTRRRSIGSCRRAPVRQPRRIERYNRELPVFARIFIRRRAEIDAAPVRFTRHHGAQGSAATDHESD
jgi:hypothetical protein